MKMPLARYFFYMGGVLLALLFISNAYLPNLSVADRTSSDLPVIRIHSDRKLPELIVYDTSPPATTIPAHAVNAGASAAVPAAVADISAKAQTRGAFAQMQSPEAPKPELSDSKKHEPKLQGQRKIAKRRAAPRAVLMAQQPQFGLFGNRIW
jgi:hypothetical protein